MASSGICEYCRVRYRDDNARFCDRCGAPLPGREPDYWKQDYPERSREEKRQTIIHLASTCAIMSSDDLIAAYYITGIGDTDYYRWNDPRLRSTSP